MCTSTLIRERVLTNDAQQLERTRTYRPQKGSWAWSCQVHAPCPCTGCFQARDVVVSGLWRPVPACVPQSRWHTLTLCGLGDASILRERASGWLSQRLSDFGTQQAHYALAALSGAAHRLDPRQQHAAEAAETARLASVAVTRLPRSITEATVAATSSSSLHPSAPATASKPAATGLAETSSDGARSDVDVRGPRV
jgi:hypothetical protein